MYSDHVTDCAGLNRDLDPKKLRRRIVSRFLVMKFCHLENLKGQWAWQ